MVRMTEEQYRKLQEGESPDTEAVLQKNLMTWAEADQDPALDLLFHIPNGGVMPKGAAGKLKGMGMKKGIPDLFLPVPRGEAHGLFLEVKTTSGRLRKTQEDWITKLREQGYAAEVAYGFEDCITILHWYLDDSHDQLESTL